MWVHAGACRYHRSEGSNGYTTSLEQPKQSPGRNRYLARGVVRRRGLLSFASILIVGAKILAPTVELQSASALLLPSQ